MRFTTKPYRLYISSLVLVVCVAASLAETTIELSTYGEALRLRANQMGDSFGAVAKRCDVNGDGLDDVVISANDADGPGDTRPLAGEAYILYGRRQRWIGEESIGQIHDVVIYGRLAGDNLATHLACADINDDGYDDLVLGAFSADANNGQRVDSGQVQLVFGGAALPAIIDLATAAHTTIWGAASGYLSGRVVAAGDINGDGFADVVINARNAPGKGGTPANTGRAYVVFGRSSWPSLIDLLNQADLTIYGAEASDRISDSLMTGDLDRDGTVELLVGATAASGPGNIRPGAGELSIFRGRASWPLEINLATTAPTTVVFGADNFDRYGGHRAVRIGDVDGDGSKDLLVGGNGADGAANTASSAGESRTVEFGAVFPTQVDLRTASTCTIFGKTAGDSYGYGVEAGDISGDGTDDIWIDAVNADGPGDLVEDSGEARFVFGGPNLPATLDLAVSSADLVIYGDSFEDGLAIQHTIDINGDGISETVLSSSLQNLLRLPSVWFLSPFDIDGDGFTQLIDNCPLVANPSQGDVNDDQRGDACATDWDGDGLLDAEDCAPNRSSGGKPRAVSLVRFAAGSHSRFEWNAEPFSNRYDVSRATLPLAAPNDFGICITSLDQNPTDTVLEDAATPPPGSGFGYLVSGWNAVCKLTGSLGRSSAGAERVNSNPARCP